MSLLCVGGGGGGGGEEVSPEEKAKAARLAKEQAKQEEQSSKIIKMLLLGAGESGKSTIFKQMKVINKNGYSDKEKKEFISICHGNTVGSMKSVMLAFEKLEVPMSDGLKAMYQTFETNFAESEKLLPENFKSVVDLYTHPEVAPVLERRAEYQLNDSADYYLVQCETLSKPDWLPSTEDILHSRVRTTGIVQSDFKIKGLDFAMFDVGGQRNERRKWIHCFDSVNAVVFVASLSEFDQKLFEDETQDRMSEAYSLFDQICNSKWFRDTSMILFLNKKDLFEMKLEKKVFADFNNQMCDKDGRDEYKGANTLAETSEYVKTQFLKKNKGEKSIFSHATCATDTSNVKFVFDAVVAIVLENNMKASGLA